MIRGQAVCHIAFDILIDYLPEVGEERISEKHSLVMLRQYILVIAGFGGRWGRCESARGAARSRNSTSRILAADGGLQLLLLLGKLAPTCLIGGTVSLTHLVTGDL